MSGIRIVMSTLLGVVAMGAMTVTNAAADDAKLRADLERLAQRRIFFGHQSVGNNLLDGIKQLATVAGVNVPIVDVKTAGDIKQAMIGHTFISENGRPLMKIENFDESMGSTQTGLDIAFMKFCYVDFTAATDVKALFARYTSTMEKLQARNPGTTFVHVTAPLTSEQSGAKELMKRMLGRGGSVQNARRDEYNSLLRKTYQGREPIFDLARVESVDPEGRAVTVEWNGTVVPAMAPVYTNDGGHLNSVGKLRAARELISVLAAIPVRPASPEAAR